MHTQDKGAGVGEPGQRVCSSSAGAWLYMRTTWPHFKYAGAKRKSKLMPLWTVSKVSCTLWRNDFSFIFSADFSVSDTHTENTHRHTRVHRAGSSTQWAAGSTAFLGSSFILQLHLGQSPTEPRNKQEQREALLASPPTSFPPLILIAKGPQDPVPFFDRIRRIFPKDRIPPACSYWTQILANHIHFV